MQEESYHPTIKVYYNTNLKINDNKYANNCSSFEIDDFFKKDNKKLIKSKINLTYDNIQEKVKNTNLDGEIENIKSLIYYLFR